MKRKAQALRHQKFSERKAQKRRAVMKIKRADYNRRTNARKKVKGS